MGFPLDDNFVFGDNFFSWLIIFFSPKATKKITQPRKKITHQQTKLLIQRKPHYVYDMTFLCPPPFFVIKSESNYGATTRTLRVLRGDSASPINYQFFCLLRSLRKTLHNTQPTRLKHNYLPKKQKSFTNEVIHLTEAPLFL